MKPTQRSPALLRCTLLNNQTHPFTDCETAATLFMLVNVSCWESTVSRPWVNETQLQCLIREQQQWSEVSLLCRYELRKGKLPAG